jgi:hypothetical protein
MLPKAATRVQEHTPSPINQKLHEQAQERVAILSAQDPDRINERLQELDREWDTERILQTNFAVLTAFSVMLGVFVNRKWLRLAIGVPLLMIQHALQGWCPPLSAIRRIGVRTPAEIEDERFALRKLLGDFDVAPSSRQHRPRRPAQSTAASTSYSRSEA